MKHIENIIFSPTLSEDWSFLPTAAAACGFVAVGVAPAGCIHPAAQNSLNSWLKRDMHAGMDFVARTISQRENIQHPGILRDAVAVIVVALPYGNGAVSGDIWPYVARHARGVDYHISLKQKLHHLAAAVQTRFNDCRYRAFTDSAPIAERAWAVVSGIGTIGKSGALLVPNRGPKVLLGELVCTNVPPAPAAVAPSEPFATCGGCTACMDACPAAAIVAPGVVDGNRCLSYWTVERKKMSIPPAIGGLITSIYGCDACTAVCPLSENETCGLTPTPAHPRPLDLTEFIHCSEVELSDRFKDTGLSRPGWSNLKTNATLVLRSIEQGKSSCLDPT